MKYPARCVITGVGDKNAGQLGVAELTDGVVKIVLDDGIILNGDDCSWEVVPPRGFD